MGNSGLLADLTLYLLYTGYPSSNNIRLLGKITFGGMLRGTATYYIVQAKKCTLPAKVGSQTDVN